MVMPLHQFAGEQVALVRWLAGESSVPRRHPGGEEIFVLSGKSTDEQGTSPQGTWLRKPPMSEHCLYVEQETAAWIKMGHLSVFPPSASLPLNHSST